MVVLDKIAYYTESLFNGPALNNFNKMDADTARDTALKAFAVAVIAGIIAALILPPVLIVLVAEFVGGMMFAHDTMNYDAALAGVKRHSRKS